MTRFIEGEGGEYGWPELLCYPVDEPGRHPESVELMRITLKAIHNAGARSAVPRLDTLPRPLR
jgi:hypothetical protein